MFRMPFESEEAIQLNKDIFETIYFAAMTASKDLAKVDGAYESFEGSPASEGIDRKSTRLNSSHGYISYAVFCLKKKII